MSLALPGIGIGGRRVAIGQVYKLTEQIEAEPGNIRAEECPAEIARFKQAIQTAIGQLKKIRQKVPKDAPEDILAFIDTHLLMLNDHHLAEKPIELIKLRYYTAEWALQTYQDHLINIFESLEDEYIKSRQQDVEQVIQRVMAILKGHPNIHLSVSGRILVAVDLSPADTIHFYYQGAVGLITEFGSSMSHTAILARSLGIPALVGAHSAMRYLKTDEWLILDAENGMALVEYDQKTQIFFQNQRQRAEDEWIQLLNLRDQPAITQDEHYIHIQANIELEDDLNAVLQAGAEGIGLYRTEFLYMNRDQWPDEEEHYQNYLRIIEKMAGRPITIRSVDIGMDKPCRSIPSNLHCTNPALSLRAVRLYIQNPALFRTQIRAVLRAAIHGQVRFLLPMLTDVWEAQYMRALIDTEIDELLNKNQIINPQLPIGAMIETPAAALIADILARSFDFLSIGTNDLIQYTLAVDRIDDTVNYLYDPLHPAVLRLIQSVVQASQINRVPLSMCGEMAGEIDYIPLLIGMGLEVLSMHPSAIPEAKRLIRGLHYGRLKERVQQIMDNLDHFEQFELEKNIYQLAK